MGTKGDRLWGGMDWGCGTGTRTLRSTEWLANGHLPSSPGNSAQCSVLMSVGKEPERRAVWTRIAESPCWTAERVTTPHINPLQQNEKPTCSIFLDSVVLGNRLVAFQNLKCVRLCPRESLIQVELMYKVEIVSAGQQSVSVVRLHASILFQILFPQRQSQNPG